MYPRTLIVGVGGLCCQLRYHYSKWITEPKPVFLDNINNLKEYDGCEVINSFDKLPTDVTYFIIAVANPRNRRYLTDMCKSHGLSEREIGPEDDIYLSDSIFIDENTIIMRGCLFEENSRIGYGSLLNTRVSIHHDSKIGNYVTIAPNSVILGNVDIGDNTFIGAGTIIREKIKIGNNCLIGMGSVVINNIPDNEVWHGNPARFIRKNL